MHALDPERWHAVSSYLDQALALPEEERAFWIASLRRQNPSVAADVEALLEEHRALRREGFLEDGPDLPPGIWSSVCGRAHLMLGRALGAAGKRDEACAGFRTAAQRLESTLGADHDDRRDARLLAEGQIDPSAFKR